jgi:hypothetical protein
MPYWEEKSKKKNRLAAFCQTKLRWNPLIFLGFLVLVVKQGWVVVRIEAKAN